MGERNKQKWRQTNKEKGEGENRVARQTGNETEKRRQSMRETDSLVSRQNKSRWLKIPRGSLYSFATQKVRLFCKGKTGKIRENEGNGRVFEKVWRERRVLEN